ncbi:hypothetical protein [Psychroserpens mesophilus]|uniref:hypothetical protein n=1 Tax=Psychroserpens mesophilus TaxID=325473 RepID=UPI00058F44CA|nr:hypothetical protein [Psychroserpens mesophilus]
MNDLILNKQRNQSLKREALDKSIKRKRLILIKPLLMLAVLSTFIILSIKNNNLFLSELLISGGILMLIFIVYLFSQKEANRNNL